MKKSAEDKIAELEKRYARVRPVPGGVREPAAQLLGAVARGERLVCKKFFQAGGVEYKPGDVLPAGDYSENQLAKLAAIGYIIPGGLYDSLQGGQALKDLLNKSQPLHTRLLQARGDAVRKAADVARAAAELKHAQDLAHQAANFVDFCESELDAFLSGEHVDELLG